MLRVQCPQCEKRYRTELEACGKVAVCTRCHASFRIGESRPPFEWKPSDLGEDSWIGVPPPEEKRELKHCIMCDAPLEPDAVRCLACGASQLTGVVRRPKPKPESERQSIGTVLPLRLVLTIAILGAIAVGGYWALAAIGRSASKTVDELAEQRLVTEAARRLRDTGDEASVRYQFGPRVKEASLPQLVDRFSAADVNVRRAAALLIAGSSATKLQPVLAWVKAHSTEEQNLHVLHTIGARRLVELSGHADAAVRQTAAEMLCLLSQLPPDASTLQQLAEAIPAAQKIERLNKLCRPLPEAVGEFAIKIEDKPAPFVAAIEQIGRVFYLRVGSLEFASAPGKREFLIPIEQWCAATSPAVDPIRARDELAGSMTLQTPLGIGWEGSLEARTKRDMHALPGFIPLPGPFKSGQNLSASVRLQRAAQ